MASAAFQGEFFNQTIRSQIDLLRYEKGLAHRVIDILEAAQKEIITDIAGIDPLTPKRTDWQRARMANLNGRVQKILDVAYGKADGLTQKELSELSVVQAKGYALTLNKAIGFNVADVIPHKKHLESIAKNTLIDGRVIGEWWQKQNIDTQDKLRAAFADVSKQLQIGQVKGESIGELVGRVRGNKYHPGVMNISKREANALVRTAVHQVTNEAKLKTARENQDTVKGIEIIATLDKRTTPICRAMDGKRFRFTDDGGYAAVGHNMSFQAGPPYHWQCRTTTKMWLKPWSEIAGPDSKISKAKLRRMESKIEPSTRAAMGQPVSSHMTYDAWLKQQDKATQIEILGPGRYALWQKNMLSMVDMVTPDGKPLTIGQLATKIARGELGPEKFALLKAEIDTLIKELPDENIERIYTPEQLERLKERKAAVEGIDPASAVDDIVKKMKAASDSHKKKTRALENGIDKFRKKSEIHWNEFNVLFEQKKQIQEQILAYELEIKTLKDSATIDRVKSIINGLEDNVKSLVLKQDKAANMAMHYNNSAHKLAEKIKKLDGKGISILKSKTKVKYDIDVSGLPDIMSARAIKARDWYRDVLDYDPDFSHISDISGHVYRASKTKPKVTKIERITGRACAEPWNNRIFIDGFDPEYVYIHEMGHCLEWDNNDMLSMVARFFNRRTKNGKIKHLGGKHGKDEVFKTSDLPKKFDYATKVYLDGRSDWKYEFGEILSVGLQNLYMNPMKFLADDEDYFRLIISALRREYSYGID